DTCGAFDVAFHFTADRHRVRAHAAGELGPRLDGEVALDVDVALEPPREPNVPGAIDLTFDRDVGRDDGLPRLAWSHTPRCAGARRDVVEKSGSLLSAGSEGGVIVGASFLGEVVSFQIAMFDVLLESRTNTGRLTRSLLSASPFTKCYPRATIGLGRQRAARGKLVSYAQGRDEKKRLRTLPQQCTRSPSRCCREVRALDHARASRARITSIASIEQFKTTRLSIAWRVASASPTSWRLPRRESTP